MKYFIFVSMAVLCSSTALAQAIVGVSTTLGDGKTTQSQPRSIMSTIRDGKSYLKVQSSDGTNKEYVVPYYTLSKGEFLLRELIGNGNAGKKVDDALLKQAQGQALTPEETALIKEIAADSAVYDSNMAKIRPVCEIIEGASGRIEMVGMGAAKLPECKTLSADQISAAPNIDTGKGMREAFSIAGQTKKYRFVLPKAERDKIRRQNIDLAIKWSEME